MTQIQPRALRNKPLPDYEPIWQSGPPPSEGWWPASASDDMRVLRFWNGRWWSDWVVPYVSINNVEFCGCHKAIGLQSKIRWAQRWWE